MQPEGSGTRHRIVVMTGSSPLAGRVARVIAAAFPDALFLVEDRAAPAVILRRRIRRQGVLVAAGQVAFRWHLSRLMRASGDRIAALWQSAGLPEAPVASDRMRRIPDVNGPATLAMLRQVRPDVVLIFAVSKLAPATLQACGAPVLNLHPGITPAYRGVHSGYWALRNGDLGCYGATVHLVDHGLDTGAVLDHLGCLPDPVDTVATHTQRLVLKGLPAFLNRAQDVLDGRPLAPRPAGPPAPIFHEPTLWSYIFGGIFRGIW